jgi:hypothetical protein
MLRGTKPLAYFLNVVASEFHFNIRYRRMFDRHVAAGRLIKREVFEVSRKAWSDGHERRFSELLGYESWQIEHWLRYRRARRAGA